MVQSFRRVGRMRYGPGSSRERHDDSGAPSAIQHSKESLTALAKRYGISQKTVAKWKRLASVADLPTGPREPKSRVLSVEEEAIIVVFRRHTLLPLDDCLYAQLLELAPPFGGVAEGLSTEPSDLQAELLDEQALPRLHPLQGQPRLPIREDYRVGCGQILGQIESFDHANDSATKQCRSMVYVIPPRSGATSSAARARTGSSPPASAPGMDACSCSTRPMQSPPPIIRCLRCVAANGRCVTSRTSPTSWWTPKARWKSETTGRRPAPRCSSAPSSTFSMPRRTRRSPASPLFSPIRSGLSRPRSMP
ncbi:hypothetical protein DFO45_0382 [Azorhizobium sp. AG788]|nr:hypothetical protein DFO45_0382 [Azorhizobium sp. AG788]